MNFQRLNIFAFGVLLILIPAISLELIPWKSVLVLLLIYSIILGWGVFDIGSQFFIKTYWKGEKGNISFTFDDGPHPEITQQVLQVLKKENVKATFFCIGKNAEKYPEIVKQIVAEGHVVGNHTYDHAYVFSKSAAEKQIVDGAQIIQKIIGKKPVYFRPPFGVMIPEIAKAVKKTNCAVIGWDLRSQDGNIRTVKTTVNRVKAHLKKSTLLLFHDTNPTTPEALREVIHLCHENGMDMVSLPDLIGVDPYG